MFRLHANCNRRVVLDINFIDTNTFLALGIRLDYDLC